MPPFVMTFKMDDIGVIPDFVNWTPSPNRDMVQLSRTVFPSKLLGASRSCWNVTTCGVLCSGAAQLEATSAKRIVRIFICRTSQISHDPGWRGACASTTRDSWGRCAVAPGSAYSFLFDLVTHTSLLRRNRRQPRRSSAVHLGLRICMLPQTAVERIAE